MGSLASIASGRGLLRRPTIKGHETSYKALTRLQKDDLVYSKLGAFEGAVAVVDSSFDGSYVSPEFPAFAINGDVDPRYLRHYVTSERFEEQLRAVSSGIGARQKRVHPSAFLNLMLPRPSLPEQRRMAAYLDALAANLSATAALASEAQTRLPVGTLPRTITLRTDSENLPTVTVRDLVDPVNDTVHPGDDPRGATEFVGLEHIESHTGRNLGGRPVGDETGRKFRFCPGEVTYGYLRPYLNKVWVADRVGLCSVEQFVLRPRAGVNADLVGHVLRGAAVLDAAIGATNRLQLPRLRLETLMSIEVPDVRECSPPLLRSLNDLRHRFVRLEALRAQRTHLIGGVLPAARNEIFSAMR